MHAYAVSWSKYINIAAILLYTLLAFICLPLRTNPDRRHSMNRFQRVCMAVFCLNSFFTIGILNDNSVQYFAFGVLLAAILLVASAVYRTVYKLSNMLLFNNICMFLSIGLVIIARLNFEQAQKQAAIACAGLLFMLIFPALRNHLEFLRKLTWVYAVVGLIAITGVLVLGATTYGSKISYTISGITFQPSEFVKVLFVLFLACMLSGEIDKNTQIAVTAVAILHVAVLVLSKDLGSALVYFAVFLTMVYLATGDKKYALSWLGLGAVGAVACYFLFSHVRVRVEVWRDPFAYIDSNGYQVVQSLFSISFGGLTGAGLTQGSPDKIPFVTSDFIFAAITEEMGIIFGVCLILLCLNVFLDMLMLCSEYSNRFYQLILFGTAVCYLFQTFITIGGETKFIPLTGVTLPLVSYGGSSVLSTFIMFGLAEAVFMLQNQRILAFAMRLEREEMEKQRAGMPYGAPPTEPGRGGPRNGDGPRDNGGSRRYQNPPRRPDPRENNGDRNGSRRQGDEVRRRRPANDDLPPISDEELYEDTLPKINIDGIMDDSRQNGPDSSNRRRDRR